VRREAVKKGMERKSRVIRVREVRKPVEGGAEALNGVCDIPGRQRRGDDEGDNGKESKTKGEDSWGGGRV
jgi:hypothetical protein